MLHLLWSIIVGFIVGLIASAIMHTHMGFIGTTLLGIIASIQCSSEHMAGILRMGLLRFTDLFKGFGSRATLGIFAGLHQVSRERERNFAERLRQNGRILEVQ